MSARFPAACGEGFFLVGSAVWVLLGNAAIASYPQPRVEFFFAKAEVVSEFVEDGDFNFVG